MKNKGKLPVKKTNTVTCIVKLLKM